MELNNRKFKCDICNISFTSKKHHDNHLKTKKHSKACGGKSMCQFCFKKYTTKYNLLRHIFRVHEICDNSISEEESDQIVDCKKNKHTAKYERDLELLKENYQLKEEKYKYQIELQQEKYAKELFKQKAEMLEKDKEFNQGLIKTSHDIIKTTIKTTDKAVSGLAYVRKNYPDAPVLKKMDNYDTLSGKDDMMEILLFYARKGRIAAYLGDFLIKFYKKEEPFHQSIWATDSSRLTFIVKELLKNKSAWNYDKKGLKVRNIIIDPLLEHIKKLLREHITEINEAVNGPSNWFDAQEQNPNNELDNDTKLKLIEEQKTATQLICDIDNKTLSKAITKHISPQLSLVLEKQDKEF